MTNPAFLRFLEVASIPSPENVAEQLFERFHTLDGVMSADVSDLVGLVGERTAMLIKLSAALMSRTALDLLRPGKTYTDAELEPILIDLYRGEAVEKVYVLSFDAEERLIAIDLVGEGTVNCANVIPRKVADAVFKRSAVTARVAHNHPAGVAIASKDDIGFTAGIIDILRGVGVELSAHYTVAGNFCRRIM